MLGSFGKGASARPDTIERRYVTVAVADINETNFRLTYDNSDSTAAASLAANHFEWYFIIVPVFNYFKQAAIIVRSLFLESGRV